MGENLIFSSDYFLPESPDDNSGNFKGFVDDGGEKDKDNEDLSQLETRLYSLSDKPAEEADQVVGVFDDEEVDVIDDKDLEKEEKEEEKDIEKEEKEDEKVADKAAKDAAKDEKEDEKDK